MQMLNVKSALKEQEQTGADRNMQAGRYRLQEQKTSQRRKPKTLTYKNIKKHLGTMD